MEELDLLSVGKQSIQGVMALISQTFVVQLISAGSLFIILTILTPADIGIFTAVTAMREIVDYFTDFGFGAALVQKKQALTQDELTTSFTIQAGITLLIFLTALLFRSQISGFLKLNPAGERLFLALMFIVFVSSFKTIPAILMERTIQFHKLVLPQVVEALVYNVLLVVLVLKGFHVDSYTYAFLISSLASLPLYYYVSPWKIRIGISREALMHLKFGIQFQAKSMLATIKDDLITVFLVKVLSFAQIGYIGFAQRIAYLAYKYVVDSITKVTFSTYSRIQENLTVLKKAIERSLFFVSAVMFPVLMGIMLTVPTFIHYFPKWHNKWEPAILSLIFFCLNAGISCLSGILVNILDSTGRVKTTLNLMVIWTSSTWALTALFIYKFGYNGVAAAAFVVSLTILYTIYLVKKVVDFEFIKSIYKSFICSLFMGIIVFAMTEFFVKGLVAVFVVAAIGGAVYIGSFYLFAKKELDEGISLILKKDE